MPATNILIFQNSKEDQPLLEWLEDLENHNVRAFEKCLSLIVVLSEFGNELRRPLADMLEDGIYELRSKVGKVNYRLFYFFHGSHTAVLSHGTTKEGKVDPKDIKLAKRRKELVKKDADKHTVEWEVE